MTSKSGEVTPPKPPKFPRGGLRSLHPDLLEDESVYRGVVLEDLSLEGRALQAVSFEGCVFRKVNLSRTSFSRLRLLDVRFEGCDLSGADWPEASLERVQFSDCRLLGFRLPGARLRHVRLTRVQAHLSLWVNVDAKQYWLEDCDLTEADFYEAALPASMFRNCRLSKTDFHGAMLVGADLRGSELKGVRLGLREVAGVLVEPQQLPDLAHLLEVSVQALDE